MPDTYGQIWIIMDDIGQNGKFSLENAHKYWLSGWEYG